MTYKDALRDLNNRLNLALADFQPQETDDGSLSFDDIAILAEEFDRDSDMLLTLRDQLRAFAAERP